MRILFSLLLLVGMVTACSTPRASGDTARNLEEQRSTVTDVNLASGVDLTAFIRRLPGVQVQGEGAEALIRVRGTNTLNSNPEPLYIVGGMNMGHSFSEIYASVDLQMVEEIRVLKDPSETGIYGVQGGSGVIVIELKK